MVDSIFSMKGHCGRSDDNRDLDYAGHYLHELKDVGSARHNGVQAFCGCVFPICVSHCYNLYATSVIILTISHFAVP